jgi:hypothetical protein
MYIIVVILLMFIFPLASLLIEEFLFHSSSTTLFLIGKWFVFWAVGIRLFTAGLRQVIRPQFTAEEILGIKDSRQFIIVQELGFANIAMGTLGICSILNGRWVFPGAIVGCLFLGLDGIRHIFSKKRNFQENTALVSDLFIAILLLFYISWAVVAQQT